MDEELYTNPLQQYPPGYFNDGRSERSSRGHYSRTNPGFNAAEEMEFNTHFEPQSQIYDNFNKRHEKTNFF